MSISNKSQYRSPLSPFPPKSIADFGFPYSLLSKRHSDISKDVPQKCPPYLKPPRISPKTTSSPKRVCHFKKTVSSFCISPISWTKKAGLLRYKWEIDRSGRGKEQGCSLNPLRAASCCAAQGKPSRTNATGLFQRGGQLYLLLTHAISPIALFLKLGYNAPS